MEKGNYHVICLEDRAFEALLEEMVKRVGGKIQEERKWIGTDEAMDMLQIKSKTTLQELRDTGKIRFTQPQKKLILYDRMSINEYLERHVKNTF